MLSKSGVEFKKGDMIRTTQLEKIIDKQIDPYLIKNRRKNMEGTVDSPIYLSYNKYWLVRHNRIRHYKGIPICFYAVYHENDLEIIEEFSSQADSSTTRKNIYVEVKEESDSIVGVNWLGDE